MGESKRIYQLAKEYKVSSSAMINVLQELGFKPKSHMSVASDEMQDKVKEKFTQQKQAVKQEMAQRAQGKAGERRTSVSSQTATKPSKDTKPPAPSQPERKPVEKPSADTNVAKEMKKAEKKQRRKDRRRKRSRKEVDQSEVAKSFKSTMANLQGGKSRRKYRREGGQDQQDAGPDNLLRVNEYMSVAELANMMDVKPAEVIAKLFEMGMMATINQRLDMDTIEMVASEYNYDVEEITEIGETAAEEEHEENLESRAPVVTVMGHVDHGKTSLLDYIRKTNVAAGEAGAITQHIGAYEVSIEGGNITFLDTPGHEAFTAMRARGSQITDIVVLVVAADDGVRPQTLEAIDHARAANAPIIVAITKVDKPTANPDKVRTELSNRNLLDEAWGGKTIMVEVSNKSGDGIEKLLEMILLQAEVLDLKSDPSIRASGVVVESELEKGRGPVATVLIQKGTAHIGDSIVSGTHHGRIRTMTNDRGQALDEAGPATPVQITGLSGVPQAGDTFMAMENDQEAKEISTRRSQVKREQDQRRPMGAITLDKVFDRIKEGQIKEVRLIIKGDVQGSVEVLSDTLGKIETDEVKTTIIRGGAGAVTESDVLLASASDAIIIAFQVSVDPRARETAKTEKVDIRSYDIIYEAENDVKKALEGLLSPEVSEEFAGMAEVRDTFRVPKIGVIAGSYVKEGRVTRTDKVRLIRDGRVIYEGTIKSLRRFKDDAREVKEGYECGIGLENFDDIKVGDQIEALQIVETARTLS